MRRSGAGAPELLSLANRDNRENPAPFLLIVIILEILLLSCEFCSEKLDLKNELW